MRKIVFVVLGVLFVGVLAAAAARAETVPTWSRNATAASVAFYDSIPGDLVLPPTTVQCTAIGDTVRVSFHAYVSSAWVYLTNDTPAYGDTSLTVLPGETTVFHFTATRPDLVYVDPVGSGKLRVWAE